MKCRETADKGVGAMLTRYLSIWSPPNFKRIATGQANHTKDLSTRFSVSLFTTLLLVCCISTLMVMSTPGANIYVAGGSFWTSAHVSGTNMIVDADATLSGTGTIHAPTTIRGTANPGYATSVGTLTFSDTLTFDDGRFLCYAASSNSVDRITASGQVSGVATVEVTRATDVIPKDQIIIAGSATSDYASFDAIPIDYWHLGQQGALDLILSAIPGLIMQGSNEAVIASGNTPAASDGTLFPHSLPASAVTNTFSITNNGIDTLIIDPSDLSHPTDFSIAGIPATVDAGAVSNFTVTYVPTTIGDHTAFIVFTNNSPDSPFTLNLAGSCYAATTNNGPYAGGNTITITNGILGDGGDITNVLVGGVAATITGQGTDWVTITLPATGSAGVKDILIQSTSIGDTLLEDAYTYNPAGQIAGRDWTQWQEMESLSEAIIQPACASFSNKLYCAGGYDEAFNPATNVYEFNGTTWNLVAGLPMGVVQQAMVSMGDKIYSLGGENGSITVSNAYVFDGVSWSAGVNMPIELRMHTAGAIGGSLYVVGGAQGQAGTVTHTNILKFDGSSWSWAGSLDQALYSGGAQTLSNLMYVLGAQVDSSVTTNCYSYDGVATSLSPAPGVASNLCSWVTGLMDDKIYVAAGATATTASTNAFCFDGVSWTELPGLPAERMYAAGGVVDGVFYVAGGLDSSYALCTNVYRYPAMSAGVAPSSGSWTGGYQVVITGSNLGDGSDITNVTLAGVTVASIDSQSATQVVVTASSSLAASGDVVVHSVSYGTTIRSNAFTYLEAIMSVLGTNAAVIGSGQAASSDNGTDFGWQIVGMGSLTNTFSITNSGNTALHISGVTTSGAGATSFEIRNWPASVAMDSVATFDVIFEPDGGGTKNAALNFANSSTGTPYVVNLAGFGSGGGIALATNQLAYTATYVGSDPAAQLIQMDNVGVSGFTYTNLHSYSPGASDWLTVLPGTGTVPNGGSTTLTNSIDITGINAGSYTCDIQIVAADATNSPQSVRATLVVAPASQTITFPYPGGQETTNEIGLAASATSGLTVSFAVDSGPGTLASGTNLSFTGAGDVVLTASQAGNSNWNAAASITHTIVVSKAVAPVTINNLSQVYDGTARSVTASTTPGGLTVNFTYEGNTWAPTNAGSYAVTGVVSDIMYQGWKTGTLVVAKADQTITFPAMASQTYTSHFGLAATAGSGFTVSFVVSDGPGSIADDTNLTFTATGAVSIVASQAGDANWNAAPSVTNSFMVNKADQVITFPAIADQETTNVTPISATALSTLGVTFSIVSGPAVLTNPASPTSLTYTNDGTVIIAAHQVGSNYWNAAPSVTNTFNVIKAVGAVMLSDLTQVYDANPLSPTSQTSPTGLTVNLTFDGSTNLPVNVGSYIVIGTMDDPIYQSAATDTFTIVQATQTIVFAQLPDMIITDTWGLSATGGASTNPITFAVLSGPASIAGGTNLSFNNVGEVLITANQAGDSNYLAAITLTNVFNVSPTTPEISTPTVSNILAQTATLGATIDSTNGAPVTERGVIWWTDRSTNIYSASEAGAFGTGAYSLNVTGIVAGITNFFQGYAVNVSGTVYSTTSEFLARPDAPEVLAPTNIQATSFYANWNAAEGALTYYLDVSETNTFDSYVPGYQSLDMGSELTANVTGLGSVVWYYYRVRAENAQGLSTNSATRTAGLMMDLVIAGNPVEHDTPAPLGYGTNQVVVETMVTNSVTTPADESNGVRYACTGWTGTGDVPAAGLTNTVSFLFTTDSTLTWHWKTQYLITQESTGGYVYGLASGWKDEGWIFDLTPRPTNGYIFAHWLTNGSYAGDAAILRVVADAPKEISAIFAPAAWDVNVTGTTSRIDWQVVGPNGFGTFEICNPSDSGMLFMDKFLFAIMPNGNMHIRYPDGTAPSGEEYVDVTTEVQTKLQSVGNMDQIMDPGECVTLDPIEFLGKNPAYLDAAFYSKGTPDMYDTDTDGDTIPNYWEEQEGLNLNNPLDGGEDQDEDGVSSEEEYLADTNPFDAASYLHIRAMNLTPGAQQVEWIGGSSVVQYLEWNAAMDMDVWSVISTNYPPTPITNLFDDTYQNVEGYYRIRAVR